MSTRKHQAPQEEKKTEEKLLRMPPALKSRLTTVATWKRESATTIINRGIEHEVGKIEAEMATEKKRLDALNELARANGGNLDTALEKLKAQLTAPALPGLADLASSQLPGPVEPANAA